MNKKAILLFVLLLFSFLGTVKAQGSAIYFGFSSYPRTSSGSYSTAVIQDIIETMDSEGLNVYRMSIYYTQPVSLAVQMAEYYLTHCNYDLILCRHVYNPGGDYNDWNSVQSWVLGVLSGLSQYQDRLIVEFVNEFGNSDLGSRCQDIVDTVRGYGYTAGLCANKWDQSWGSMNVYDPLDEFYVGYHFYFNSWSVNGAIQQMQYALDNGYKIINTEIGADFNEENAFSSSEVQEVNDFMDWCYDRGIGNCVWQRYNLENWDTYQNLGLQWPAYSPPPSPTPTPSPSPSPTPTPTPEVTPNPSPTPTPTVTPSPTVSPSPSPTASPSSFLDDFLPLIPNPFRGSRGGFDFFGFFGWFMFAVGGLVALKHISKGRKLT